MLKGFVSGEEKDIKRIPMKGKNLWINYPNKTTVGVLITSENGVIRFSGVCTTSVNVDATISLPAGKYKLAANANRNASSDTNYLINLYKLGVLLFGVQNNNANDIASGTLDSDTDDILMRIRLQKDVDYTGFEMQPMLNAGEDILPWEPYGYQEGWEVRDNQDRLIWGREDELQTATGTLPFKGYTLPVKVKSLLGNAVQNGTPAPDNIVTPEMCGKLVGSDWTIPLTNAGQTTPVYLGEVPTVRRVKKYIFTGEESITDVGDYYNTNVSVSSIAWATTASTTGGFQINNSGNRIWALKTRFSDYTTPEAFKTYLQQQYAAGHPVTVWYILATPITGVVNEPLCKISTYADELTTIGVHGLSAPLYGIGDYKDTLNLSTGVVTRKVKKLVLTGNETGWQKNDGISENNAYYRTVSDYYRYNGLCSHYATTNSEKAESGIFFGKGINFITALSDEIDTVGKWKSYLAQQYQAGTPVTIWYVLNTPTTETVTVPTGMTGEIKGYLTQVSAPTPTNWSVPKWNGVEESGGTYAVTVYTPPEIPTTTGENTLTVDSNLAPSKLEVSVHAKKIHYGFKIDKSNDDSDSAVIYTHDAVTMTPAHMDFTNDRFDYGSWGNAFFVRDCYPVALNLDGTIAYRLDPDDYTKKTDGTASDIFYELLTAAPSDWNTQWKQYYTKSGDEYILNDQGSAPTFAQDTYYKLTYNSSFTGNFMMAFPKVWFYRHEDSQYNYIEISNYKLSDDWKCYAHINASGQEVDFIYLPLFKGVIKDSKLRSLPGQIPQGGTNATTEVNAATALGSRWQILDHSSVELINDLLTLMSKSIDSQGRFGKGRESGYNSSDTVTYGKLQTGTLVKGGKFKGFSSSYKEVKVFGIEGFWANRWDRLQGMLLVNNVWKIKMTPPYNFTGTDFVTLSNASVPTGNGYLSKVQTSEYGSIPASIDGGSSTKYFKDYFYKTATDTRVALRGGACYRGAACGFRYVYVYAAASASYWDIGASPVYK